MVFSKYKVAIFVDWENIKYSIFQNRKLLSKDTPKFDYNRYPHFLPHFFTSFLENNEEVYRIFFYATLPFKGTIHGKDYSKEPIVKTVESFLNQLAICDLIALRKGELVPRIFKENGKIDFVQKKIDMLIGLDIAHVTYNKLAERIMIFCYDTDLQPALKTARVGGLQVILPVIQGVHVKSELKAHSDFIRIKNYTSLCKEIFNRFPTEFSKT